MAAAYPPYVYTKDDTRTPLRVRLTRPDGELEDLAGLNVTFNMVADVTREAKVIDGVTLVLDQVTYPGECIYEWQATDVDTAGRYWGWFVVKEEGKLDTFPAGGDQFEILIKDRE